MTIGTVVKVAGKLDERVREQQEDTLIGTIIKLLGDEVWVLLPDGNIWIGSKYSVYEEQSEEA